MPKKKIHSRWNAGLNPGIQPLIRSASGRPRPAWAGSFEVKNNLLYYRPAKEDGLDVNHALQVAGKWDFAKNGRLRLIVDSSQNRIFGRTIAVGSELSRARAGSLEFKAAHRITSAGKDVKTITLSGCLTAMPGKKLAFKVEREGVVDTLQLSGRWDVFENNQIGCSIKRICDGKQVTSLVIVKGAWEIAGNTLFYETEWSDKPFLAEVFEIRRAVYTNRENGIEFSLGAGLERKTSLRTHGDTIILRGAWKQEGAKAEFIFSSSRRQSFIFILSRRLSNDKELVFELDTAEDEKPSFAVTFSKKIKADSSFFIRGKVSEKDKRIEAGFYFPF